MKDYNMRVKTIKNLGRKYELVFMTLDLHSGFLDTIAKA